MPLEKDVDMDFEARYATVMDGMLRSAVAETTRLYEAMVEELRAGICTMRRENDALRSRCTVTRPAATTTTTTTTTTTAAAAARGPRSRQDAGVQCDLIPVGTLLQPEICGDGSHLLMKEGDEPTPIDGQEPPTDEAFSNRGPTALQQEHGEVDDDSSCEMAAQSQLSAVITPPPDLEEMAQHSNITQQIPVTSASSETAEDVSILDQDDSLMAGWQQSGVQHPTCSEKEQLGEISVKEQHDIALKPSKTNASLSEGAAPAEENPPPAATEMQRRQPKNAQGVHSSPSVPKRSAMLAQITLPEAATEKQLPAVTSHCASTQTCSSLKKTISSILVEPKVPPSEIPVSQQKGPAVVRLTRLTDLEIPVCKEEIEPIPLTPAVVQDSEAEDIKPILSPIKFPSRTKKGRLVRDGRTPRKMCHESSSSTCANKTSGESIPVGRDKTSSVTANRSRSGSKIVTSHKKLGFTKDEPTQVHAKRLRLSHNVVSPKMCRLANVKLPKEACGQKLTKEVNAVKFQPTNPNKLANAHPTTPKLPSSNTRRPLTKSLASTPKNWTQIPTAKSNLSSPQTVTIPHNTGVASIPERAPPIVSPLQPLAVIGRRLLRHQCGVCGRVFSSTASLETHVGQHPVDHPFTCSLCGKTFTDNRSLRRHVHVHRNGGAHVCKECGKGFAFGFSLNRHFKMVHVRVKPFACQFCNKDFFSKVEVESHLRVHTGEKPFECNLCEKRYARRMDLNVHLRWHNGEKRYWCPYCERGFLDSNNLKRHTYTHTGEKPHQCPHCLKRFTQSANLKKHLKNVHKLKP